jgi:hypothetical protein
MESLHGTVCLLMIGSGLHMGDVEEGAQCRPQGGSELWTPVAGDGCREAKPLNPSMKETGCAVGGGHSGQRYRFRPAGSPVQDGKEIGETGRAGKGTNKINMDMRKTAARNLNLLWLQMNMFVHLAALAVETRTSQNGNLLAHVWPAKSRGNQL